MSDLQIYFHEIIVFFKDLRALLLLSILDKISKL